MEEYIFSDLAMEMPVQFGMEEGEQSSVSPHVKRVTQRLHDREVITYITPSLFLSAPSLAEELQELLSKELYDRMNRWVREKAFFRVLVVGLGNGAFLSDSLGPRTMKSLVALGGMNEKNRCGILCLTPDVTANTGIESADLIRGVVDRVAPDLILTVDALSAKSYARLGASVQLSELGVSPGSGIGNRRKEINRETMGIPVISIGVPTVVRSSTLVAEALRMGGIEKGTEELSRYLSELDRSFVTPKEIDWMVEEISYLLATVIHRACLLFGHK